MPRGDIPGPYLPKSLLVPPPQTRSVPPKRGLCPKKVTCSVPLECISRPETPKILVITPEIVCTNCFFADFAIRTDFFCGFTSKFVEICTFSKKRAFFLVILPQYSWNFALNTFSCWSTLSNLRYESFCASQNLFMPPNHAILTPGLTLR